MLTAWLLFPAVLTVLAAGCGLLVDAAAGARRSRALVPAAGLATMIVAGQLTTLADATAELTLPLCAALALAGLAIGRRRLGPGSPWPLAAALAVFGVYAAPIVLSGDPSFAGYIRLDDTATWMALTDRVMEHGHSLAGLAPSSYEATLDFNLAEGYPVGAFLPLGIGARVVGADVAWLIDPYMAWLAAVLALALWTLARPLIASGGLRALVAAIAAQSALLYGYYLWGGVKEVAAAALVAAATAGVAAAIGAGLAIRALLAPAVLIAALIGVLSVGGAIWVLPALAAAAAIAARTLPPAVLAGRAALLVVLVLVLSAPVLATGGLLPPTSAPLTDADARGNLVEPLEPSQVAGIWPAGDFRFDPAAELPTAALIAAALMLAAAALVVSWRRRAWAPLLYVGGGLVAAAAIWLLGSPWVDGKAMAIVSPAIPFAAGLAAAFALASGHRALGAAAVVLLAAGVLWSNALAYRDANIAPYDQLAELERIGEMIDGQGPTLMTEYQPYGVRHFLRDGDPEGASELRRRQVPLAAGGTLSKGETADTDALDPAGLYVYRTLVLRRSPTQSRPPAAYRLLWRGDFYEVWQRPEAAGTPNARLPLGGEVQPVGRPECAAVRALAADAGKRAGLAAARRPPVVAVALSRARYPRSWAAGRGSRSRPAPRTPGTIEARVEIPRAGAYELWLRGSVRPRLEVTVDGFPAGDVRHQLENAGQYVRIGSAHLGRGSHLVAIHFDGADLHPGSGGAPAPVGPLVLSVGDAAETRIVRVPATRAAELCRRSWDWIERARGAG